MTDSEMLRLTYELAEARAAIGFLQRDTASCVNDSEVLRLTHELAEVRAELEEWRRNAEEYSQEAKSELDRRLAAEARACRLQDLYVALEDAMSTYDPTRQEAWVVALNGLRAITASAERKDAP